MTEKIVSWWDKPSVDQRDWPLHRINGWAPGQYTCTCRDCGAAYMGDKRSWQCYPCAESNDLRVARLNEGAGI